MADQQPAVALTLYPLSQAYRQKVAALHGAPVEALHVSDLRKLSLGAMFRRLRQTRPGVLYLPFEDEASVAALPIVLTLATATRARRLVAVNPDGSSRRISRWQIVPRSAALVWASLAGQASLVRTRLELRHLLRQPRTNAQHGHMHAVAYLKTNLWFGLKAGGSVGHVAGVANALRSTGHDVTLLSADEPVGLSPQVKTHRIRAPRGYGVPFETNHYRFGRSFTRQALAHLRPKPDAVYQRLSVANHSGVVVSRKLGVPLIVEYNGSEVWVARNWGRPLRYEELGKMAEEACLRHAHLVVTVSRVLQDELVARGVEPSRVLFQPNAIDPAVFNPDRFGQDAVASLRARYGIPQDALVATFVGTFGPWHGVGVLAQAIRRLVETRPDWVARKKLWFMLVGDGALMSQVVETLRPVSGGSPVVLTGLVAQHEAPVHLAASDILLSPHVPNPDGTPFFGSPTKLFEYMAMGKPIVASELEQIGEVLRDSVRVRDLPKGPPSASDTRLSVLATAGDIGELLAGIEFLVESPKWRAALGANARRQALAKHTWEHHVHEIVQALAAAGQGTPNQGRPR